MCLIKFMKTQLIIISLMVGIAPWLVSHAEPAYPNRPLTIVVPFPAGGAMDFTARTVGQRLSMELGQPVVIENIAGAGGAIGAQNVARSKADGYRVLISNQGPNVIREILEPETPYRTNKDFVAISTLTTSPLFLVTSSNSQIKRVSDLVKIKTADSKTMNFGSAGIGSQSHIAGEGLNIGTGHAFLHIPYSGASKQAIAVLSGEVNFAYLAAADVLPKLSEGSLRALGVASEKRFSLAPEVPTLREAGIPNQIFDVWYGLLAPAKTAADRIKTLQEAVAKVMQQDEIVSRFREMGVEVRTSTGADMMERFKNDHVLYSNIITKARISIK